jgi:hypothetical protein
MEKSKSYTKDDNPYGQACLMVEIPKYIRQIKLSDKQRPIYYVWNGRTIKAKSKLVPMAFIKNEYKGNPLIEKGIVKPEFLHDCYKLVYAKNKREIIVFDTEYEINSYPFVGKYQLLLCKTEGDGTYETVIANAHKINQPRYRQIKGQDIFSGTLDEHTRGEIMYQIKKQYKEHLREVEPMIEEDYPFFLVCELHDTVKNIFDDTTDVVGVRWDVGNRLYPYMKAFPDTLTDLKIIKDDERLFITGEQIYFVPIASDFERKLVFYLIKDTRSIIKNNPYYNGVIQNNNENRHKFVFNRKTDLQRNTKGHGQLRKAKILRKKE